LIAGVHVRVFAQGLLEFFPIEKLGACFDVLAAGQPIGENRGHEIINRDVVFGGKSGGLFVQILGYCDALAYAPSGDNS
jgi:hypothetical protein